MDSERTGHTAPEAMPRGGRACYAKRPMARCRVDKSIKRKEIDGISFPLGVYPVEEMTPRTGFTLMFEPSDGDTEEGEWEEWPDRYVFDIMISATRVESLCRSLFAMLPGRFYPILDVLGHDEYREVDPYVSYELVGQERFHDALRRYRGYFFEDGLVGFGAMSEEPFLYVFVDEHKIVTVRVQADMRERMERLLAAFDLTEVEEIAGADAALHEHRGVLDAPDERLDLLTADEIVEDLRNDWGLVLNIDPDRIGVWGASAGGHLAALLATSDGDQALEGTVGTHLGVSSRVQSCCNFFGPTDLADLTPKHGSPGIARLMGGTPAEMPAAYAAANPITYIDKTDVPFLIMHGDKDNIVPLRQSEMLETALKAAGVPVSLFVVKGAGHGFAGLAEAKMVVEFFERTLAMSNGNAPKESAQPAGDRAPNPSKAVPTEKTPVPNGK